MAIATRTSGSDGGGSIRIQAHILRESQDLSLSGPLSGFALIPEEEALRPVECPAGGTGDWREADVDRVIAAAKEAGLTAYRVEIAPDGTISIIVG